MGASIGLMHLSSTLSLLPSYDSYLLLVSPLPWLWWPHFFIICNLIWSYIHRSSSSLLPLTNLMSSLGLSLLTRSTFSAVQCTAGLTLYGRLFPLILIRYWCCTKTWAWVLFFLCPTLASHLWCWYNDSSSMVFIKRIVYRSWVLASCTNPYVDVETGLGSLNMHGTK